MNILVTAGNTQVPIDQVRCITNIFTGRTGARIALHARQRGHVVALLTSHPDLVPELRGSVVAYRTFDQLRAGMEEFVRRGGIEGRGLDAIIHTAAVSDYLAGGVYAPGPGTSFRPQDGRWEGAAPALVDRTAGKVKSDEPELWLRLVRAPKLIDMVRGEWGFRGILVKFKLEVGVTEARLLEIAKRSRQQSAADLMVANTLEAAGAWVYLGPLQGEYQRILRSDLEARLLDAVERLHGGQSNG